MGTAAAVPAGQQQACGRWQDHRQVIDGILHRVRTGVQWRNLPARFGPWKTVYEATACGRPTEPGYASSSRSRPRPTRPGRSTGDLSVDSTIVRAHQHAAGARTEPPTAPTLKGGRSGRTPGRTPVAEPRRLPGGGGAGSEGLGRPPGGFTTKLHPSVDGRCP
ncbi:transposase [Streptomyces flaveolus]|uniref:transposase n=1 Tax=Streptomyces flaveolus TaxID=67297 RepID=UPI0034442554